MTHPTLPAHELMSLYPPRAAGTAETWQVRWQQAWDHRVDYMLALHEEMRAKGWIGPPLLMSWDCEVWDGHHRLLIAWALGLDVPYLVLDDGPRA